MWWTKDIVRAKVTVGAEEMRRVNSNAIRNKVVAKLLHQNSQYKVVLHRWGLDHGLLGIGGSQGSKPPKAGVGVL